jgi:hypothetical protein
MNLYMNYPSNSGSQPEVATKIRVAREFCGELDKYEGGGESKFLSKFKQNDQENIIIESVFISFKHLIINFN